MSYALYYALCFVPHVLCLELRNPVPDAEAVRDRLQDQNVQVFFARDCGIKALEEEFALFVAAVRPGDAAFLFFACHGVMLENSLRLIAISNSSTPDIEKEAMNLDMLLARLMTRDLPNLRTVAIHAVYPYSQDCNEGSLPYHRFFRLLSGARASLKPTGRGSKPQHCEKTDFVRM